MASTTRNGLAGFVTAALGALLLCGCSGVATKDIEAERVQLHSEPLAMNAKGLPDAHIDASGAVAIGDQPLALTDAQRSLARSYRAAVIELVDATLGDAEHLANHAMATAIFGMLTGRSEHAEQKIDAQAEAIAHTPQFCGLLGEVRQRQDRMVQSLAELAPYAKVTRQEVEDCIAGQPYEVNL